MPSRAAAVRDSILRHGLPSRRRLPWLSMGVALVMLGLASDASADVLSPQKLDVAGMTPKLVASRDKQRIFLLAASPTGGKVRVFDVASLAWKSGIPDLTTMDGVDLTGMACEIGQCWGGPSLAVGQGDVLHVVWGERGWMDCDPTINAKGGFFTSVNLKYSRYDGGSWTSPYTVITRKSGVKDPECAYQFPNLAEDGAGNLLLSYMHGVYVGTSTWDEGSHYFTYTASTWTYRQRIAAFAQSTHVAGGFGHLFLGYALPGQAHVAEIDPSTGKASTDAQISKLPSAPYLLLSDANELHALVGGGQAINKIANSTSIYYDRRTSSGWQSPQAQLVTDDATIFVPGPTERTAVMSLAVLPSGRRLLAFSYAHELYFVRHDGSAWGTASKVATGNAVLNTAVAAVGNDSYLVVWSTSLSSSAEIWWALVPSGAPVQPDAGPDAGPAGPDAGDGGVSGDADASGVSDGGDASSPGGCECGLRGSHEGANEAGLVGAGGLMLLALVRRRKRPQFQPDCRCPEIRMTGEPSTFHVSPRTSLDRSLGNATTSCQA